MILRLALAAAHLLALGIGLGSVWGRARALGQPPDALDASTLRRVLRLDAWWGIAGLLWLVTGLVRVFTTVEKGSAYYFGSHAFLTKMGLFVLIVVLEVAFAVRPLGAWRGALRRGDDPDLSAAGRIARVSTVQAGLVVVMVGLAATMARGLG